MRHEQNQRFLGSENREHQRNGTEGRRARETVTCHLSIVCWILAQICLNASRPTYSALPASQYCRRSFSSTRSCSSVRGSPSVTVAIAPARPVYVVIVCACVRVQKEPRFGMSFYWKMHGKVLNAMKGKH